MIIKNKQKSFTLIELLVVIVIIGILAGVIMISTSSSIDKANIAKIKVFEESVQNNLAANMVSAWDADHVTKTEAGNWTLNDKWGSNNGTFYDGTVTTCSSSACPQIVNDKQMGNVLSFDGVNDYIDCGNKNIFNINDSITLSTWVKSNQLITDHWRHIIGKGAATPYAIFLEWSTTGGYYRFEIGSGGRYIVDGPKNEVDVWMYLVGTYNKNNGFLKIYKNGKFYNQFYVGETGKLIDKSNINFKIGGATSRIFNGFINNARIYDAAISSSQVKQNYIAGLNSMLANGNISKQEYNERINNLAYNDNNE